jgi:hypothetical protein
LIELVAGFLIILIGQLSALKLKNIRVSSDVRATSFEETISSRNDYMIFNHRGREFLKRSKH